MKAAAASAVTAAVAAYLVAVGWLLDPYGGPVLCPLRRLTGLECPGCGSTRAVHELLHGDVLAAVRLNALVVPALLLLAAAATKRIERIPALPVLVAVVAYGVTRNLV